MLCHETVQPCLPETRKRRVADDEAEPAAPAAPANRVGTTVAPAPVARLFVKTLTGKTIVTHAGPRDTVDDLKLHVQARGGIPPDQQRLIFGGVQLDDRLLVCEDYGITDDATLHLVLRLRGGMFHATSGRTGEWDALLARMSVTLRWGAHEFAATRLAPNSTLGSLLGVARESFARRSLAPAAQPVFCDVAAVRTDAHEPPRRVAAGTHHTTLNRTLAELGCRDGSVVEFLAK